MTIPAHRSAGFFAWILPRCTAFLLSAGATLVLPSVSRAQEAVTLKTLYSFIDDNSVYGSYDGPGPQSLLRGKDGSIYGTTAQGGPSLYGTIFKLSPTGQPVTIYSFTGGNDGGVPFPDLVQDDAGNFYGVAEQGGANNNGTVFKLTPAGSLIVLHSFTSDEGYLSRSGVTRGPDGNFFGVTSSGQVYRVSPMGDYTLFAVGEYRLAGPLILGRDGNLYGPGGRGYFTSDTVVQVSLSGATKAIGTYLNEDQDNATLIQGRDGNFYGTTDGAGFTAQGGTVFRLTADGTYTLLHRFSNSQEGQITGNSKLLEGSDGNFYGAVNSNAITDDANGNLKPLDYGSLYQITPTGVFTTLYTFHGVDGTHPQESGNTNPLPGAALVQGPDGSFYGTTATGGTDDYGTVFQATLRPGFFAGTATLDNGVYYLALPKGNPFGYFSFLNDANYLYHFDLGYEYVFNANDGHSGVYFYDFASSTFFYTSPSFPFPYLYDFSLNTVLYYYPDPNNPQRYNTDGVRYFYNFATGQIITK